jgi:hypothetical protein
MFVRGAAPMPIGTIAFTPQVIGDPQPFDPATSVAYRAHVCRQQREPWTEQGTLLALDQQTFAVIK